MDPFQSAMPMRESRYVECNRIGAGPSRTAASRLRVPLMLWMGIATSAMTVAEAANPFAEAEPRNVEALLVLLAGVGALLVAAAVIAFAIRQMRKDAAERRRTYLYRRRVPGGTSSPHSSTD
jgi:hypothetical protein